MTILIPLVARPENHQLEIQPLAILLAVIPPPTGVATAETRTKDEE